MQSNGRILILVFSRYGWLHYKTDKTPLEKAPVNYAWMQQEHTANPSGSSAGLYIVYTPIHLVFTFYNFRSCDFDGQQGCLHALHHNQAEDSVLGSSEKLI